MNHDHHNCIHENEFHIHVDLLLHAASLTMNMIMNHERGPGPGARGQEGIMAMNPPMTCTCMLIQSDHV